MDTRMILRGYSVNPIPVYTGIHSLIYSGIRETDHTDVIIKALRSKHPSPNEISRIKQEYEILKLFVNEKNIVHVDGIEKYDNSYAIIMENIKTSTLADLLSHEKKIKLSVFIDLAIEMAETLRNVHQHNIIHKDINPTNIMCDYQNKTIKLLDFSLSVNLPKEHVEVVSPKMLEASLTYISPEQSGRMNRGIDYRTDYYSLGVIFYQMLTGIRPFVSNDLIELIHDHIAIVPTLPEVIDPTIPHVVSEIIMKLLSKNPEDRYQNMNGLIADLKTCKEQLITTGKIQSFTLGKKDIFSRFQIPEKLYGRKSEVNSLMNAYEQVMKGDVELMLVAGYPGIGKSSLVHEIHKPILAKHGYFISGKFDQFKQNTPYSAITQAFDDFVKQVLTEPKKIIEEFHDKIIEAVGKNGKIIADVIPSLTSIIGEQPPVIVLTPTESFNRFSYVFQKFIRALSGPDHPIVIFLDDLQWADQPSLKMIETLLTSVDVNYLFIIGAYRSNEVSSSHSLMLMLKNLQQQDVVCRTIDVGPLTREHVAELLSDTLHQDQANLQALANICHEKTNGNPFFLIQLLHLLHRDQLIKFDDQKNQWVWQLDKIKTKKISDNVVDLMINKIKELTPVAQEALQIAACIGDRFNLEMLSVISKKEPESILIALQELLTEGFIFFKRKSYHSGIYQFAHDRIHQAAQSMVNDKTTKLIHLNIARLMLQEMKEDDLNEMIFNIADHYNVVITPDLPDSISVHEIKKIAEINLSAAKTAKSEAAFESAMKYLEYALKCVNNDTWETDYEFMFELYTQATETACLCSMHNAVSSYARIAIQEAKDIYDEIKIIKCQLLSLLAQGKHAKVLDLMINTIKRLGINIPKRPSMFHILMSIFKIKLLMINKKIPDLLFNPEMTDPDKKAIMDLFSVSWLAAFYTNSELFALMTCISTSLSMQYGNTNESVHAYCIYSVICCGALENFDDGEQFAKLAFDLSEKLHDFKYRTLLTAMYHFVVAHRKFSVHDSLSKIEECILLGLNSGDFEVAGESALMYCWYSFLSGIDLKLILEKAKSYAPILKNLHARTPLLYFNQIRQTVYNLTTPQEESLILKGPYYNEINSMPNLIKDNNKSGLLAIYLSRIILCALFEKYDEAIEPIKNYEKDMKAHMASFVITAFYFYKAIILFNIYSSSSWKERWKIVNEIKLCHKKLSKYAKYSPANHAHRVLIIEAEWAWRIKGKKDLAVKLFDKAIATAKQNEFLNEEAIANELAAKFYLAQEHNKIGRVYMEDARHCYLVWGAKAKVASLDAKYPELLKDVSSTAITDTAIAPVDKYSKASDVLDMSAIQKSSTAIASTIILSDLLDTLMHIVIKSAGAQKCYILLNKNKSFVIEAEGNVNEETKLLQSIKPTEDILPMSIVNYVIRSKEYVVLDNATRSNRFMNDTYITTKKPTSILAVPLINQNTTIGILYLENNLAEGVFTEDRIHVLNLLSSQIAISIYNARLLENTKALNISFERFVPEDFLSFLNKSSIADVKLGDHIEGTMTVLFADIRNFTSRSENMTPQENFDFINSFFKVMAPVIRNNHGFVDKYIGDAIMSIFPRKVDDAVQCALEMQLAIKKYNKQHPDQEAIKIGIGINTGSLMLGIVGEKHRMSATVISNTVNIAFRVEALTKTYNTPILITEDTYWNLSDRTLYRIEKVASLLVRGKSHEITIYKVDHNHDLMIDHLENIHQHS